MKHSYFRSPFNVIVLLFSVIKSLIETNHQRRGNCHSVCHLLTWAWVCPSLCFSDHQTFCISIKNSKFQFLLVFVTFKYLVSLSCLRPTNVCVVLVSQSCTTLWDLIDGTVIHQGPLSMGFFQARILEWVPFPSPADTHTADKKK